MSETGSHTGLHTARQSRQWDYSQPAQYQTYGGGGYQPSRTGPAASYVIGVQPAQQYGTQQYGTQQYGAQPVSYPAQYNPYPAAAPPPVYDPYQAVPPQPTADMALAGTQQYAVYPVPLDQYASADSSYASYAPAPAPSYGPPIHGGGYGGGGGGYGGGGYDNSPALSALALLSFLFLLNLIQQTLNNNNNTGTGGTGGTGTATGGGRSGDGGGDWTQAWDAAQLELRVRGVLLDRVQWTQLAEETGSWLTRLRTSKQEDFSSTCRHAALCQMQSSLSQSFGLIGRLVAKLVRWYTSSGSSGVKKSTKHEDSDCFTDKWECKVK